MVCSTPMSFRFFPLFVSETEMGEVWENWFLTKTISLSPDVSEAHGGALSVHVTSGRQGRVETRADSLRASPRCSP